MRMAALQFEAKAGDPAANLARIEEAAGRASEAGAQLLMAPELCLSGYGAGEAHAAQAEPLDGPLVGRLQAIARNNGLAIITGFTERLGDAIANSALFLDGTRVITYRKAFLYGDYEKDLFEPGSCDNVIVEHAGLKIGMLICYDVEFPENVRRLAVAGVDLVAVPTALPATEHSPFIANSVVSVRAFENQVHVAYVDLCGKDERFAYAGLSTVAAPDGRILAQAGTGEEMIIADIDPAGFGAARAENPYLADLAAVTGRG